MALGTGLSHDVVVGDEQDHDKEADEVLQHITECSGLSLGGLQEIQRSRSDYVIV